MKRKSTGFKISDCSYVGFETFLVKNNNKSLPKKNVKKNVFCVKNNGKSLPKKKMNKNVFCIKNNGKSWPKKSLIEKKNEQKKHYFKAGLGFCFFFHLEVSVATSKPTK